jgi:UMF1 family MFS transporter
VLQGGLVVYALICGLGFFLRTAAHFYALAVLVGLVQGGCQALSRSLFASMVPRRKSAEFFGFFSTSGRAAGIAGPLLFAVLGQFTGQGRWAILVLTVFFLGGAWLLGRVDLEAGRRRAQAEDAAP